MTRLLLAVTGCLVTGVGMAADSSTTPTALAEGAAEPVAESAPAPEAAPAPTPEATSASTPVVAESADASSSATTDLPGDDQLLQLGARIGSIEIVVDNVFDPSDPKESGALYRAANALHIRTRESTIRPQLLFKPGQLYSQTLLDETARNLRGRRYLADATVVVKRYHPESNTVDIEVRTRDVWTLNPGTTYGRSGGATRSGFQLEEQNLLGWGKAVKVQRTSTIDRSVWDFGYRDPNLLSTRWDLTGTYRLASDGDGKSLQIQHPFFSLDTRYSGVVGFSQSSQMDRRFEQGVAVDQYITEQRTSTAQLGWSTGRRGSGTPWVLRSFLGYQVDDRRYRPDPVNGTLELPANRNLRYPWLGWTWQQDHYVVTRNRERIERTEDMFLGRAASFSVGYSSKAFDADNTALLVTAGLQDAYAFGDYQNLFVSWSMNGRRERGQWLGTTYNSGVRYDWRNTTHGLLVFKFNHTYVQQPDDSQQLYLGSDEGMRGYPLRYRSGNERSVFTLEQRLYSKVQILRLLSVGAAAFVDAGHIVGQSVVMPDEPNVLADVGLGLRLGNIRSSGGEMFHFDLAYPFNAPKADRKLQFSIITKTTF